MQNFSNQGNTRQLSHLQHAWFDVVQSLAHRLSVRLFHLPFGLLLQTLVNVGIEPVASQLGFSQLARSPDRPQAASLATMTFERLHHVPFRTGVEEGEEVVLVQVLVLGDPHFHLVHVILKGWCAGMIDVKQVGAEIDMGAVGGLNRGPSAMLDEEVAGDGTEERASWQSDKRSWVRLVLSVDAVDFDEVRVTGLLPGGAFGDNGHGEWMRCISQCGARMAKTLSVRFSPVDRHPSKSQDGLLLLFSISSQYIHSNSNHYLSPQSPPQLVERMLQ